MRGCDGFKKKRIGRKKKRMEGRKAKEDKTCQTAEDDVTQRPL